MSFVWWVFVTAIDIFAVIGVMALFACSWVNRDGEYDAAFYTLTVLFAFIVIIYRVAALWV